jgi:alpha-soluble NSF attachment protein
MGDEEQRGRALMTEADKAFRRKSMWDSVVGSTSRLEEAKEKYSKAANLFKMAKAWSAAGEAFERCAEIEDQLDIPHEALQHRTAAADMYRLVDINKAVTLYRAVAQKNCEIGRFARAAQTLENVGELLENENNLEGACEAYQKAADWHMTENNTSRGAKAQEKVAYILGMLGNYDKAAQIFESLGTASLDSSLIKFAAKKHYMHSAFCLLARGDAVACRLAMDRFAQLDLSYHGSREANLLVQLAQAYEDLNPDAFSQALVDYDSVQTLSSWETAILLRIKEAMRATGGDDGGAPDLR